MLTSAPREGIVYQSQSAKTGWDLWVLSEGATEPEPYLRTEFQERDGNVSPDGRWLAYISNESGRDEVFVSSFPNPLGKWQLSTNGGRAPSWRADGRELLYVADDNRIVSVEATTGDTFSHGAPRPLFVAPVARLEPALRFASADGTKFLVNALTDPGKGAPITIVVNWVDELDRSEPP